MPESPCSTEEKPPQWEARAPPLDSSTPSPEPEKSLSSKEHPALSHFTSAIVFAGMISGQQTWVETEVLQGASTWNPAHDKVVRRRPDKQGRSGLQGCRKAAPALTLKMVSVFLMLAMLDYSLISVTWAEGLPRSLSKQNQLRTLINMSTGRWYPIRLSRMKGVFQFRPLCWHSSLLGKCILMHMTAHNTLIINSIKNPITQRP